MLPYLVEKVEEEHNNYLIRTGKIGEAISKGNIKVGLIKYAENNQWGECLDTALQQGIEVFAEFMGKYASVLFKNG